MVSRPEPIAELTEEQSEVWRQVTSALSADWFPRETYGLLAQYCRHVVSARRVAELIAKAEQDAGSFSIEDYDKLLKMQEREGRALSSLATRMRISQQGSYNRNKAKKRNAAAPWLKEG